MQRHLQVKLRAMKKVYTQFMDYLQARFPQCEAWQISATGRKEFVTPEGVRVASAIKLLGQLV
jgi:hypothetical protein